MPKRRRRVRMPNEPDPERRINVDITEEIGAQLEAYGENLIPTQNRKQVVIAFLRYALAMARRVPWHKILEVGAELDSPESSNPPNPSNPPE